ncbi:hypothetical protein [Devosia naphthalenivorans]|uniref:hypothetical protein n=1 Tax=Devosia naphthalenivorans TaxID=2082392 RepID=UPI0013B0686C|nr:hypothetical protein [Devosia naphthalenivorans]
MLRPTYYPLLALKFHTRWIDFWRGDAERPQRHLAHLAHGKRVDRTDSGTMLLDERLMGNGTGTHQAVVPANDVGCRYASCIFVPEERRKLLEEAAVALDGLRLGLLEPIGPDLEQLRERGAAAHRSGIGNRSGCKRREPLPHHVITKVAVASAFDQSGYIANGLVELDQHPLASAQIDDQVMLCQGSINPRPEPLVQRGAWYEQLRQAGCGALFIGRNSFLSPLGPLGRFAWVVFEHFTYEVVHLPRERSDLLERERNRPGFEASPHSIKLGLSLQGQTLRLSRALRS